MQFYCMRDTIPACTMRFRTGLSQGGSQTEGLADMLAQHRSPCHAHGFKRTQHQHCCCMIGSPPAAVHYSSVHIPVMRDNDVLEGQPPGLVHEIQLVRINDSWRAAIFRQSRYNSQLQHVLHPVQALQAVPRCSYDACLQPAELMDDICLLC